MENIFDADTLIFLSQINFWLVFLPLIVGIFRFKKLDTIQVAIFYIVILTIINDVLTISLRNGGVKHIWILHLYVPLLFVLVARLYKKELNQAFNARTFNAFSIIFVSLTILNSLFLQKIEKWPSNMILLASIFYILLSVFYFYNLLKSDLLKPLERKPLFWFNSGLLLYNSSTLLLFLFVTNILKGSDSVMNIGFGVNAIFNLVLLTSYAIALWVKPQL